MAQSKVTIPRCKFYGVDPHHCSDGGVLPAIMGATTCESHSWLIFQVNLPEAGLPSAMIH